MGMMKVLEIIAGRAKLNHLRQEYIIKFIYFYIDAQPQMLPPVDQLIVRLFVWI